MQLKPPRLWTIGLSAVAFWAGIVILAFSSGANADPPSRVARLGYVTGAVSFSPGGENDWVQAALNRPLTTGDRLWADARARAEIQFGGTVIRMSEYTGVSVLNFDDRIAQLQLTQGTLNVRVRRLDSRQAVEVDTPNLAFILREPGEYRIEVDADGNTTAIAIRSGRGEVYGKNASYAIDSRQAYRFTGVSLREYDYLDAPHRDEFDRWSTDRDRRYDNSGSARYVSPDVVGYEDLDANGSWRTDATYGNVWFPNRVASGWAPYRDGHWAWIDPWGWTWMDDAPWGYAVSHYGRWTNVRGNWGWVPGPVRSRAYYAPALVAFVGGNNFQLTISSGNVGGVAWFPLAPQEVYRPSYAVSRGYFDNVNRSNTVINATVINNHYNNANVTNAVYANRQVPGAVVAVPMTAFTQAQAVSRAAVPLTRDVIGNAPVGFVPRVAPTERSVRGAADQSGKPPGRAFERAAVARSVPPAARAGFAAQQQQLAARPGTPLDDAARKALKPAPAAPAPVVNVVIPAQVAPPTASPPRIAPAAPAGKADARGRTQDKGTQPAPAAAASPPTPGVPPVQAAPDQRSRGDSRASPAAPTPRATTPAVIAPPAPVPAAAPAPEQRGKSDPRSRGESRSAAPQVAPIAPPSSPPSPPAASTPASVVPPKAVAPPVAPPAPAIESRGKSNQRDKAEQQLQPAAPHSPTPPTSTPRVAEPRNSPPQVVPQAAPKAPPMQPPRVNPEPVTPPAAKPLQAPPPTAAPVAQPSPKAATRDPKDNKKGDKKDDKKDGKQDGKPDTDEQKPDDEPRKGNNRK